MSFSCIYSLQPPRCKASLYLSSSSADCKIEREILFSYILPRLREEHRDDNIAISISDMRWGVVDSRTDLHLQWKNCADEILRCYNDSWGGFFFLSLQGDKFGHSIVPKHIEKNRFEKCLEDNIHMYENRNVIIDKNDAGGGQADDEKIQDMIKNLKFEGSNRSLAAIAKVWYDAVDENIVPPSYTLRELTKANREDWNLDKICLLKFFENIPCYSEMLCDDSDEPLLINRSVSEFEMKYAVSLARNNGGMSRLLWMNRQFAHKGNIYWYDKSSMLKMKNLKAWMTAELSKNGNCASLCKLSVDFDEYVAGQGSSYEQYIDNWKQFVYNKVSQSVKRNLQLRNQWWNRWSGSLQMSPQDLQEICCHYQHAREHCDIFAGQAETKALALKQIQDWVPPEEITWKNRLGGVAMAIVGRPGIGKSALIAALARDIRLSEEKKAADGLEAIPVVTRFCGITNESTDGLKLIHSICVEVQGHLGIVDGSIPQNYDAAVRYFHRLMKEYKIILFIDGLDVITSDYKAGGNMMSILAGVEPNANSRIIVSTRPDEKEKQSQKWKVCYGCDSRLQESLVPRIVMRPFEDKTSDLSVDPKSEALLVMNRFIAVHGNGKVNPSRSQINKALKRLANDKPPTPLAVVLASRLLLGQSSFSSMQIEKRDTTLMAQTFRLLEVQFGKRLTTLAFSFITFSVNGISDIEMTDLLSLDDEYNERVVDYRSCSKKRVSMHLWQRLKTEVGFLLRENKHERLGWTHRRVRTFAIKKYSEQKFMKKYAHQLMGHYFSNMVEKRVCEERGLSPQPVTLTDVPVWFCHASVNRRRYEEGLHHLIEANLLTDACAEVCDVHNICAFFKCGLNNELTNAIIKLHRAIVLTGQAERSIFTFSETFFHKVDCFMRWIRKCNCEIASYGPESGIFTTFSGNQPKYSDVLKSGYDIYDNVYQNELAKKSYFVSWPNARNQVVQFSKDTWNRGICFGSNIQFPSLISSFKHENSVTCLDWLYRKNDCKFVSVVDREVFIWNTISKKVVDSFTLYAEIYCVAVSNDSHKLAFGSKDRLIRVYDVASGMESLVMQGHSGFVTCVCFSNCNSKICSGSMDCAINLWSMIGGSLIKSFEGHSFQITEVVFSADDRRIVSGSLDKTVKMWDVERGEMMFSLEQKFSHVHSVCFHPSGNKIAVGSSDNAAYILDAWETEKDILYTLEGHEGPVVKVVFSPDGSLLASGSADHTLKVWDVISGIMVASLHDHSDALNDVKFSFDSKMVITASIDATVKFFDVATELLTPIENTFDSMCEVNKKCVNSVMFSPDGKSLVSTSSCKISVWDVSSRKLIAVLEGHQDTVTFASYNTSSSKICSCAVDGTVVVWDGLTFDVIATMKNASVSSVAFTLDGYKVVLRTVDYRVLFWDFCADQLVFEFTNERQNCENNPYQVNLVTFCPEGLMKTVSIVNVQICVNGIVIDCEAKQEIQVWDVVSRELISTLEIYPSPYSEDDDNNLLLNRDNTEGTCISRSFSFSPDGHMIATGYTNGSIVVSNVMNGKTLMKLSSHTKTVTSLCFNIEGMKIVSGSEDFTVKIWDVHGGILVTTLKGHSDTVVHVTFSPCGLRVASASEDKTVILWDAVEMLASEDDEEYDEAAISPLADEGDETGKKVFVSQVSALIGPIEEIVDPEDEFLTADELRIKHYRFQYVDGW